MFYRYETEVLPFLLLAVDASAVCRDTCPFADRVASCPSFDWATRAAVVVTDPSANSKFWAALEIDRIVSMYSLLSKSKQSKKY